MNSITRYFFVLALVLTGSVPSEMGGAAAQTSSAAHTNAPAQTEAKVSSAVRIEPLRPGFELPNGQTLHYEADWRFVTAGIASFHLERAGSQEHLEGTADSTGVVALLLRVADRFNSYFDARDAVLLQSDQTHRGRLAPQGDGDHLRLQSRQSCVWRSKASRTIRRSEWRMTFLAA